MTTAAQPCPGRPSWQDVWIVIPAYDEAGTIRALVHDALALTPRVIVVDDGSTDGTVDQLGGLPVTVLRHPTNRGKAQSLRTAFTHALAHRARSVITLDGDGQHDPADAPRLLALWQRHPQSIVIGSRLHDRARFPPLRYLANRFACFWISWAAGHPIVDSQSGYRVYPAQVLLIALGPRVRSDRFTFESEVLIEAAGQGHRTMAVPIPGRYPRHARPSHFRPVVDIAKIVAMVAARLLRQGLAPMGLYRSLKRAHPRPVARPNPDGRDELPDASATAHDPAR